MRLCHITCNKSCKAEEPKIQIRLLKTKKKNTTENMTTDILTEINL